MKFRLFITLAAIIATSFTASAFDIKEALKKVGGGDGSTSSSLGNVLGNLLSTDKIDIKSMEGVWNYSAPAVSFKSDNVLKKAGGAAASTAICDKLAPMYQKAGLNNLVLTINADSTFTMKVKKLTLKGSIQNVTDKNSKANFVFNFKVGGKLKVGKMDTYVVKSATGSMSVMFDVSKLIKLIETVSTVTNNSTIKSVSSMLNSYDGLCAGFEMKK